MKKELEQALFDKYPLLFAQHSLDMRQTCMCWGITTGDGWYNLLDNLCETIQRYITANHKPQVEFTQVKEKFGTLRIYTDGSDDLVHGMIWFAEHLSGTICDVCGKPGECNTNGWIACRCKKHKDSAWNTGKYKVRRFMKQFWDSLIEGYEPTK